MKTTIKKFKDIVIVFAITIFLLELVSFAILKIHSINQYTGTGLLIFKQTSKNGHIEVSKSSVLPIKENISVQNSTDEFNTMINTNNRGLREKFNVNNKDIDVAFFGDSWTFGYGVNDNERYSYIFSQDTFFLKSKVVNFSYINGFQPEHYEYYLHINADLHPKNVIIGLYLGNDFDSDIEETNYDWKNNSLSIPYRFVSSNGALYNNPVVYNFPFNYLVDVSSFVKLVVIMINKTNYRDYLFNNELKVPVNNPNRVDLELGKEDLAKNRAIQSLIRIQKIVKERGGKLTILLIPQNYFFDSNSKRPHIHRNLKNRINEVKQGNNILKATKKILAKLCIDYYDPSIIMNQQYYYKTDGHWNSKGHSIIGSELAKYIKERYY